jgi:hypothetical protein
MSLKPMLRIHQLIEPIDASRGQVLVLATHHQRFGGRKNATSSINSS